MKPKPLVVFASVINLPLGSGHTLRCVISLHVLVDIYTYVGKYKQYLLFLQVFTVPRNGVLRYNAMHTRL